MTGQVVLKHAAHAGGGQKVTPGGSFSLAYEAPFSVASPVPMLVATAV